jgi:GDPmannose 4,6-dehydratase
MTSRRALIIGISGQDGAYLARLLLERGYAVHGTSRDVFSNDFRNLHALGIRDRVTLHSVTLTDFRSVLQVLARLRPDEIYNLAGQTSVGLSFELPVETLESIAGGTLHLLEAIRFLGHPTRFYNACSSECFGDCGEIAATESTRFAPRSPYAVAKAAAFWEVANYREAYGIHACSGILSNHESPLRSERFVTQKVVSAACRIAAGLTDHVELGDLSIARDWGWSPEYVDAMHRILQHQEADNYIVATGATFTLQDFVEQAFQQVGLDWRRYVKSNSQLRRPTDIGTSRLDPSKAREKLGWSASFKMPDVVREMVAAWKNGNRSCGANRSD